MSTALFYILGALLIAGLLVLVIGGLIVIFVRRSRGQPSKPLLSRAETPFDNALVTFCERQGFLHTPIEGYFDCANGTFEGHAVSLSVVNEQAETSQASLFKVDIDLEVSRLLRITRPGNTPGRHAQPLGDPALDRAVEIHDAPPALLQGLRGQPELRRLLQQVIGDWGAVVSSQTLLLKTPNIPETPEAIGAIHTPMVELARWLSELHDVSAAPTTEQEAESALRFYANAAQQEKLPLLKGYLEYLSGLIGQGQVYLNTNDREVEWRGVVDSLRTRLTVDQWTKVNIEIKIQNPHGAIIVEYDPSKVPQVGAPPPWDESDIQRIFLGKGVFVEGPSAEAERAVRVLRELPTGAIPTVSDTMAWAELECIRVSDVSVHATFGPELVRLRAPSEQLPQAIKNLGWLAGVLQSTPADPALAASGAQLTITCAYCHTLYTTNHDRWTCPNCGAPAEGE